MVEKLTGQKVRISLVLSILFALISTGVVRAQPDKYPLVQSSANDLISEVNALRMAHGLAPYNISPILMGTAQAQANYMAAIGQVTHSGPGGVQVTQRLLNAGYPLAGDLSLGGFRSENVTGGSNKTASQAVLEWQGDGLHLNTMLSQVLTEIGAGVAKVGSTYYMVIDCALPTGNGVPQVYTPGNNNPVISTIVPSDIIVPIFASTPDENGLVYHEVQYGQTLWAIAIEYGVTIDKIRELNDLGEGIDIYQGNRLLIRKDALLVPGTLTPSSVSATLVTSVGTSLLANPTGTPTMNSFVTITPKIAERSIERNNSRSGIVLGTILVIVLLAGLITWVNTRRYS